MTDAFDRAVERATQIRRQRVTRPIWHRFVVHLRIYVVVNVALAAVWVLEALMANEDEAWFVHVLWGWGIGLLVHYLVVTQVTRQWWPPRERSSGSEDVENHP